MTSKLRSILAQAEFKQQVYSWDNAGVPFRSKLYVPENHPESGELFMEREDEAHLIKVNVPTVYVIIRVYTDTASMFRGLQIIHGVVDQLTSDWIDLLKLSLILLLI